MYGQILLNGHESAGKTTCSLKKNLSGLLFDLQEQNTEVLRNDSM